MVAEDVKEEKRAEREDKSTEREEHKTDTVLALQRSGSNTSSSSDDGQREM